MLSAINLIFFAAYPVAPTASASGRLLRYRLTFINHHIFLEKTQSNAKSAHRLEPIVMPTILVEFVLRLISWNVTSGVKPGCVAKTCSNHLEGCRPRDLLGVSFHGQRRKQTL